MSRSHSRSSAVLRDDELRLPRPPGIFRQFWARHPRLTDILVALICLLFSIGASTSAMYEARPVGPVGTAIVGVAIVGTSVLLLWRRRWPVAIMVTAIGLDALLLAVTASTGTPMFAIAAYTLAVHRSTRAGWIGLGIGVGIASALAAILFGLGGLSLQAALNAMLAEAIPGLIATLIGINIGNRKRYLDAVIARSRQLLVERDQQAQLAAAAERDRIAREMHDIVSHSLTVVVALSEGAAATSDRDRARDASMAAAQTARDALTEMRSMLGVLRDGDADAPLAPLDATNPADTVATAQRAGFPVSLATRGEVDAAPALRFAIGRIVQEGVTNAIRHAPMASTIDVRIDHDADPIVIEIVNDGASRPVSDAGFGLRGLAERAALLGGVVVSAPAGEARWMLRAELPHPTGDSSGTSSPLLDDAAATSRGGDAEPQSSTSPDPSTSSRSSMSRGTQQPTAQEADR